MFTTLFTFKTYLERLTYSGFVDLLSETLSVAVLFVSKQDLTVFIFQNKQDETGIPARISCSTVCKV